MPPLTLSPHIRSEIRNRTRGPAGVVDEFLSCVELVRTAILGVDLDACGDPQHHSSVERQGPRHAPPVISDAAHADDRVRAGSGRLGRSEHAKFDLRLWLRLTASEFDSQSVERAVPGVGQDAQDGGYRRDVVHSA